MSLGGRVSSNTLLSGIWTALPSSVLYNGLSFICSGPHSCTVRPLGRNLGCLAQGHFYVYNLRQDSNRPNRRVVRQPAPPTEPQPPSLNCPICLLVL